MAQSTVAQFAAELGLPTALLLEQLKSAGVNKAAVEDKLDEADKTALLDFLRKEHGAAAPKSKITLVRKQNTEIKKTDSTGRARTIQVEHRKKRVLERPDDVMEEIAAPIVEAPALVEAIAMPEPVEQAELLPQVAEEMTPIVQEVQSLISEPPKSTTLKKQILTPEQVAIREQEAKRHATLLALQAEDLRKKQELAQRRLDEEARKLAEAAAAKAKTDKLKEGTLHKPAAKEGAKPETKEVKKGKSGGNNKEWNENESKKRGLKTRGAVSLATGWRAPKGKNKHRDDDSEHSFNAPT